MADRETVARAVGLLRADYTNWKPVERGPGQPSTLEMLCVVFANVDGDQLLRAVFDHMDQSKFAPTVAELRERIAARQTRAPLPMEAWAEAMRFLHDGRYTRPQYDSRNHESRMLVPPWSHPAVALAMQDIGGLENASLTWESDQMQTHRARFDQAYRDRLARDVERNAQAETDRILLSSADPKIRELASSPTAGNHAKAPAGDVRTLAAGIGDLPPIQQASQTGGAQ